MNWVWYKYFIHLLQETKMQPRNFHVMTGSISMSSKISNGYIERGEFYGKERGCMDVKLWIDWKAVERKP